MGLYERCLSTTLDSMICVYPPSQVYHLALYLTGSVSSVKICWMNKLYPSWSLFFILPGVRRGLSHLPPKANPSLLFSPVGWRACPLSPSQDTAMLHHVPPVAKLSSLCAKLLIISISSLPVTPELIPVFLHLPLLHLNLCLPYYQSYLPMNSCNYIQ